MLRLFAPPTRSEKLVDLLVGVSRRRRRAAYLAIGGGLVAHAADVHGGVQHLDVDAQLIHVGQTAGDVLHIALGIVRDHVARDALGDSPRRHRPPRWLLQSLLPSRPDSTSTRPALSSRRRS